MEVVKKRDVWTVDFKVGVVRAWVTVKDKDVSEGVNRARSMKELEKELLGAQEGH